MSPRQAPTRGTVAGRAYLDLQNKARQEGRPTDELHQLFTLEGFLARLAVSEYADRLVVKGGAILAAYDARRPTRDIDVQGRHIAMQPQDALTLVTEIARIDVEDGLEYDVAAARAETIRDEDTYGGVRVTLTGTLATARLHLHVDLNTGDPIWPAPQRLSLPRLLGGQLQVTGYPLVMILAEKIVTAIQRGTANTRWRDFADIYVLTQHHHVAGGELQQALTAVAGYRGTAITPLGDRLTGYDTLAQARWAGWRRRWRLHDRLPEPFAHVLDHVCRLRRPSAASRGTRPGLASRGTALAVTMSSSSESPSSTSGSRASAASTSLPASRQRGRERRGKHLRPGPLGMTGPVCAGDDDQKRLSRIVARGDDAWRHGLGQPDTGAECRHRGGRRRGGAMATRTMPKPDTDVLPTLSPPGLVGRQRELDALQNALARPPAVVLIEGEAGIGKSRLLQEFLASPVAGERRTLVASCPPLLEPLTLGAVVDAARQATETVSGLSLSKLAGVLRPLFPEWGDDLPPTPEPAEDARAARHRLFRALAELLGCLDVAVLVVEDVHWADEATLEFLLFLTSRHPEDISVVVTYRPEDVSSGSLLLRLSSRLPAGTTQARLTLQQLDVAGTAELVSSMLGGEPLSEQFAAFVHQHAEGLPLAVEESVRVMYERADLTRRNGEWVRRDVRWIEVPPTVRDAVLERAGRLGPDAQAVLCAVAVLADPAEEATIVAVAGLGVDAGRVALAEARRCGLVREDARGLVSFRHALAARAVYDEVPAAERRVLHLRAGEVLETRSPLPVARLARHFREAGDADRWCRYAEQAADLALASGDEASATTLLYDLVVRGGRPARDVARLTSKIPLNSVTWKARYQGLVCHLKSMLDSLELEPTDAAHLRCQLARVLWGMEDWESARAEFEYAIPHLAHDPSAAARAMTLLGFPIGATCPAAEHLRWLRRAATTAVKATPADQLLMLVNRVSALLLLGEEEGWADATRIPEDAPTAQERFQVARGCVNLGDLAMMWGRYAEARQRLSAAVDLAERYHYLRLRNLALATRAHLGWFTGAWERVARGAVYQLGEDSSSIARFEATLVVGLLHAAAGSSARAVESFQLVLEEMRVTGAINYLMEPAAALARLWLAQGAVDKALEVTDEPMSIVARKGVWLWATDLAPARVDALIAAGRVSEAADVVTAFAKGLRGRDAPAPKAGLVLCRALVTEARGEHARAATTYVRAAGAWEALPRPYDALLARERQARALLAIDRPEDGLALLTRVFRGFCDLGARADADRVTRMLRENGVRVRRPGAGRPSYGDRLSPRELEVVQLVVAGQSNREIAQALVLSPKTVACHVDSAMRKLKVESRVALAFSAVEAGVVPAGEPAVSAE